jgi:transaldolase
MADIAPSVAMRVASQEVPDSRGGKVLMPTALSNLNVKVFADGADRTGILALAADPLIKGFTTNPTLMHQAGVTDYEAFARDILGQVPDHPFSLEVFSDDFDEMADQARRIASWASNVYVKIPVTNTRGESSSKLIRTLSDEGIKLNVTALMTLAQVRSVAESLHGVVSSYVSLFAGRVADSGRDPMPVMAAAVELLAAYPGLELIWASPREVLNIVQADAVGCHIVTVTHDLLKKLGNVGRDLDDYSLDTVRMFYRDAVAAGFHL